MASSATLTTTHLPQLRSILQEWQEQQPSSKGFTTPIRDATGEEGENYCHDSGKDIIVAFRTRPSLENEADEKFTVVSEGPESKTDRKRVEFCSGISVTNAEPGVFVAHVPGMKWSGPTLVHKSFKADLAFGPDIENEEVYQRTVVANDLLPLVLSGGIGCILAYGQTGSGKTFTMEGLEHRIARDLFDTAQTAGQRLLQAEKESGGDTMDADDAGDLFELSVTFLELVGKHATDLADPGAEMDIQGNPIRKEVPIHEDKVGDVRPKLISTVVRTSAELEKLITNCLAHRRTSATLRNAASSRSHAVLTVRTKNKLLPFAEEGQLILVDLAGSERYEDSKAHDKLQMDQSRDNNKSLMNLKDCVRAKARMAEEEGFVHIPWRSNKLTMPIFDLESRQPSRTIILAHVSSYSVRMLKDIAHSTNTLGYASPFKTSPPKPRGPAPYDAEDPRTWNHENTLAWLKDQFSKTGGVDPWNEKAHDEPPEPEVDLATLCPPGMTAMQFGRMYTTEFVERCLQAKPERKGHENLRPARTDVVKTLAVEIINKLFYLMITAKSRTRNQIMKSRKIVMEDETYGRAPRRSTTYNQVDIVDARTYFGDRWAKFVDAAIAKAKREGTSLTIAKEDAVDQLMSAWMAKRDKTKTQMRQASPSQEHV